MTVLALSVLPLAAARGLWLRRRWSRGPSMIMQLIALPVGYQMAQNGGRVDGRRHRHGADRGGRARLPGQPHGDRGAGHRPARRVTARPRWSGPVNPFLNGRQPAAGWAVRGVVQP